MAASLVLRVVAIVFTVASECVETIHEAPAPAVASCN